ncbi:MAG: sulfate transporter CysZ [Gammaproteobacteria bacterium]|nr:sulfate transporter CysZ [Gammaproteobacteria bacterium]
MTSILQNNPVMGALYFFMGLRLILRPRLRRFVIFPLAINVILFLGLFWWGASQFNGWVNTLAANVPEILLWLMWPLFALALAVFGFYTFAIAANLIAAPFNGVLAEAVEHELTGAPLAGGEHGLKAIAKDAGIALTSELRKLAYILPRMALLGTLFFIPGIQLVAPFIWFAFSAWMLAISYVDFPMGNHGYGFKEQRAKVTQCRLAAIGFGAMVTVVIAIPFLNLIAIPAAVAGATVFWVKQLKETAGPIRRGP